MKVWTHAVLGVLCACVLYFCICICSAQLSMFRMERRSRNTIIIFIIIITRVNSEIITDVLLLTFSGVLLVCHHTEEGNITTSFLTIQKREMLPHLSSPYRRGKRYPIFPHHTEEGNVTPSFLTIQKRETLPHLSSPYRRGKCYYIFPQGQVSPWQQVQKEWRFVPFYCLPFMPLSLLCCMGRFFSIILGYLLVFCFRVTGLRQAKLL